MVDKRGIKMANNIDYRRNGNIKDEPEWHRDFRINHFAHFVDEVRSLKRWILGIILSIIGGSIAIAVNIMCRGW